MILVDARSGQVVPLPSGFAPTMWASDSPTINYADGESMTILAVEPGLFRGRIKTRNTVRSGPDKELVTYTGWAPLVVRWMHPDFLFQHVGIIPS